MGEKKARRTPRASTATPPPVDPPATKRRRREVVETYEDPASEEEAIDFADLEMDAAEVDVEGDVQEDDDFEVKAEKYRRRLLAERQLAAAEQQDDVHARTARLTPLEDADRAAAQGLAATHTAEELRDRIQETLRVLGHFRAEREAERDRLEYMALLRADLLELFEYNTFLMDAILRLFPPAEAVDFLEAMEKPRPTTLRVNTLKAKRRDLVQALVQRGMSLEPLEKWSKVGLQVFESNVPVAGTVEYLAGHYMLQAAASFLPVMALAPQPEERVLDLAAAPGGKTTYVAQLMKNSGVLFANDVSAARLKSLNANLQRLGVTNCVVTHYDGVGYAKVMRNFDRVLLDAPCTGTGILSRDKSIKTSKYDADVQRAAQLQRGLLLSAIDACRVGGSVVYSTCSFLVEENEAIVDFALRRRAVEVVEMGLPFGRPGLTKYRHHRHHASLERSRRYFPHVHNLDGFYVCKLRKLADTTTTTTTTTTSSRPASASRTTSTAPAVSTAAAAVASSATAAAASTRLSVPPPSRRRDRARPARTPASS